MERASEPRCHRGPNLLTVLLVDARLDHGGIIKVVSHERLGVACLPRLVKAIEDVGNGLSVNVGRCRGNLAGHRSLASLLGAAITTRLMDGQARPQRTLDRRDTKIRSSISS